MVVVRASGAGLPAQSSTPRRLPEWRTADQTCSNFRSMATSSTSPGPPRTAIGGRCFSRGWTIYFRWPGTTHLVASAFV